jgi:predicted dehydrogenase
MVAAAKQAEKHLMVAHCIRFWPAYAWVKQAIDEGLYGEVRVAEFSRLTYAPSWDDNDWLSDPAKSGGLALDLHIHDLDFIQYLFGSPTGIRSVCTANRHIQTQLDYGHCAVSATASWMMPQSFGFKMAFSILFENAALLFDGTTLKLYQGDEEPIEPELPEGDGYRGEIEHFAGLISGTIAEPAITPEQARESVRMALETIKR